MGHGSHILQPKADDKAISAKEIHGHRCRSYSADSAVVRNFLGAAQDMLIHIAPVSVCKLNIIESLNKCVPKHQGFLCKFHHATLWN